MDVWLRWVSPALRRAARRGTATRRFGFFGSGRHNGLLFQGDSILHLYDAGNPFRDGFRRTLLIVASNETTELNFPFERGHLHVRKLEGRRVPKGGLDLFRKLLVNLLLGAGPFDGFWFATGQAEAPAEYSCRHQRHESAICFHVILCFHV